MWQNIHGHDAVAERFGRMLARGRLASTFLFVGPEGVGKRTFALALGKTLLCLKSPAEALAPCGACDGCQLATAGTHPDLLTLACPAGKSSLPLSLFIGEPEKRGQTGLCHDLSLRPFMGTRRIAVIDDADLLSVEGANALLKTLEEPPPRSVLILIGTSLAKQLPTIRSRAQIVRFSPLSADEVAAVAREQQPAADSQQLVTWAARSGGSLAGMARAADDAWWRLRDELHQHLASPHGERQRLTGLVEDFVNEAGSEASEKRERLALVLSGAMQYFSHATRVAVSQAASPEPLLAKLDECHEAEQSLGRNVNLANLIPHWVGRMQS